MTSPSLARSAEPWQEPATLATPLLLLPLLSLVGALVALMVLLLPLLSMPRISGPARAGLGPQNLVISRRKTRNSKVPSKIGYPQDCPYPTLLDDDQALLQNSVQGRYYA